MKRLKALNMPTFGNTLNEMKAQIKYNVINFSSKGWRKKESKGKRRQKKKDGLEYGKGKKVTMNPALSENMSPQEFLMSQ